VATGTTVFSRVTVVAPSTRIDLALPADVAVADLLPMLLDMAKESTPDGGARHGGWCLAKLGDEALDPSRTLASLGVVDGELLQLRRRSDNPPPPLYDDVVEAIAEATPGSYRPWTKETARKIGNIAGSLALIGAAVAALLGGPVSPGGSALSAAVLAGVLTIICLAAGAVVTRVYQAPGTGVLVAAAGALPMAFVAGMYVVPVDAGMVGRANLLLGAILTLVVSAAAILVIGAGVTTFIATATVAGLATIAFLVATLIAHPAPGIAAGTGAIALAGLSMLPRLTIQLAKLPLPHVPSNAEDLKDDDGFPDYAAIEKRAGLAHEYMTGMIIGCGATAAISAVIAASDGTVWGSVFGLAVALVLLLRARTYANGIQAVALLATGMTAAAGLLLGWLIAATPFERLLWVFGILVLLGAAGLILGTVFPNQKFSPPLRRTVDILEAILIAAVIPLALAVMDLYDVLRHVSFK
jgi:type VII secretion integral membrane protein EccD